MDHTIADESSLTETVVVRERAYTVPRDVAQELDHLRSRDAASSSYRTEVLRLRELLKALGGCFVRNAKNQAEWDGVEGVPLDNLIGTTQAHSFADEFVAFKSP